MTSSIVAHWRQCTGAVHPADIEALSTMHGLFNLDYPPPAYIGDIENAPLILLNGNGGYSPDRTPCEYCDQAAYDRALDRLHNPGPIEPAEVSRYYADRNYAQWLRSGQMALVNAVAYRSPEITYRVCRLAPNLPSVNVHLSWLNNEALPAARERQRFVIAHRNRLWNLKRDKPIPGVHFTKVARSKDLDGDTIVEIDRFLTSV